MNFEEILKELKFDGNGLIPSVIQDYRTNEVLMVAYMNEEALEKTLNTGYTWFYSRSRKELWNKGATSGNVQLVKSIAYDCDGDCLLVKVEQTGAACHTGSLSCFYRYFEDINVLAKQAEAEKDIDIGYILAEVYQVIKDRQVKRPEGSYTSYLFNSGLDKILKKIGEEASEMIIASKNAKPEEIIYESADFIYHLLVLLAYHQLTLEDLAKELNKRR
ncbi:MAG: bifunctional phosphoribosyl-AMP cyclohydrolase/phosphoribosyl-ATP diphosphatase HisIE [Bacillota bacterium]